MTVLDIMVTAVLAYNCFTGARRGLIRILFDLCAIIGGVLIAIQTYPYGVIWLQQYVGLRESIAAFISFLVIWAAVFGIVMLIGNLVHRVTKITIIRPLNIIGGAFFGGVKGFFFMLPILIPLSHTDFAFYHNSKIAKPLNVVVGKKILSDRYLKSVISKFEREKAQKDAIKKKEALLKDPKFKKLRDALKSGNTNEIDDMLRDLRNGD